MKTKFSIPGKTALDRTLSLLCIVFVIGLAATFLGIIAIHFMTDQRESFLGPWAATAPTWHLAVHYFTWFSAATSGMAIVAVLPIAVSHAYVGVISGWSNEK